MKIAPKSLTWQKSKYQKIFKQWFKLNLTTWKWLQMTKVLNINKSTVMYQWTMLCIFVFPITEKLKSPLLSLLFAQFLTTLLLCIAMANLSTCNNFVISKYVIPALCSVGSHFRYSVGMVGNTINILFIFSTACFSKLSLAASASAVKLPWEGIHDRHFGFNIQPYLIVNS